MSNCSDILQYLDSYTDGSLEALHKSAVDGHLAHCPACRVLFEESRKTRTLLLQLDEIDPPPGLANEIMSKIMEQDEKKGFFARFFHPLHIKIPVQALATALVVVISVYVYKSTMPEIQDIRPSGQISSPAAGLNAEIKSEPPANKNVADAVKHKDGIPAEKQKSSPDIPSKDIAPSPQVPDRISGYEKNEMSTKVPESKAEKITEESGRFGGHQIAEMPQVREKTQALKLRSAPALEDQNRQLPATVKNTPPKYPENHIALLSQNPDETSRKASNILHAFGANSIKEYTRNEHFIVTGYMSPKFLAELKLKLSGIATVYQSEVTGSSPDTGELILVEISIGTFSADRENK